MNFHDFDFVEAPGALGPSKSGVERLDFVGQKIFLFKFYVSGFVEVVLVFPDMCLQNLKPQPHQVNFWGYWYHVCILVYFFICLFLRSIFVNIEISI